MARINFPNSPSNNDKFTGNNGRTYRYNSAKSKWKAIGGISAVESSILITENNLNSKITSSAVAVSNTDLQAYVANTNPLISDRMQVANTNALVNDRMQVANTRSLYTNVTSNLNSYIANTNPRISVLEAGGTLATNSYISATYVANTVFQSALANTNSYIGTKADAANPVFTGTLSANGSTGTSGYILKSSGTGIYWDAAASGGGGGGNSFSSIAVGGGNTIVATDATQRLSLLAGNNIVFAAHNANNTLVISSTASSSGGGGASGDQDYGLITGSATSTADYGAIT